MNCTERSLSRILLENMRCVRFCSLVWQLVPLCPGILSRSQIHPSENSGASLFSTSWGKTLETAVCVWASAVFLVQTGKKWKQSSFNGSFVCSRGSESVNGFLRVWQQQQQTSKHSRSEVTLQSLKGHFRIKDHIPARATEGRNAELEKKWVWRHWLEEGFFQINS